MDDEIFKQFEQLRSAMSEFCKSVNSENHPIWLANWDASPADNSLDAILNDLWYHEDQDGRATRIYPGLVSLTHEQITFANEINLRKDNFRKVVHKIKETENDNWREIQGRLARRYVQLNERLKREGLNRLHLKQVFRHIPLVVNRPDKVGFSWYTSGRSIKKITKQEAYTLLCKLNTEATHIKIQLDRLAGIADNEPLARVQNQAPVLRANLVFADNKRKSMNVSLPLMFPGEGKTALPEFNVPAQEPPENRNRLVRSDNKLEDNPFLPSIRVHRYSATRASSFY